MTAPESPPTSSPPRPIRQPWERIPGLRPERTTEAETLRLIRESASGRVLSMDIGSHHLPPIEGNRWAFELLIEWRREEAVAARHEHVMALTAAIRSTSMNSREASVLANQLFDLGVRMERL